MRTLSMFERIKESLLLESASKEAQLKPVPDLVFPSTRTL